MIQHQFTRLGVAVLGLAAGACLLAGSNEAGAKGCNGYVNQLEWGRAPWDNNNGPKFPHYQAPAKPAPVKPAVVAAPRAPVLKPQPVVAPNGNRVISNDGGSLIGSDSASLVGNAGGTMRK